MFRLGVLSLNISNLVSSSSSKEIATPRKKRLQTRQTRNWSTLKEIKIEILKERDVPDLN